MYSAYFVEGTPAQKQRTGVMLSELLQKSNLFHLLHLIDLDLARQQQQGGCSFCRGPLYRATYKRKAWGVPRGVPDEYLIRLGLCCGREDCRRRTLPPSCIFWGRRFYWAGVILVVMALRQRRPDGASARELKERFGISRKTLLRWMAYFQEVFPRSAQWQRLRGRVSPMVGDEALPGSLLEHFLNQATGAEQGLVAFFRFLAEGLCAGFAREEVIHAKSG